MHKCEVTVSVLVLLISNFLAIPTGAVHHLNLTSYENDAIYIPCISDSDLVRNQFNILWNIQGRGNFRYPRRPSHVHNVYYHKRHFSTIGLEIMSVNVENAGEYKCSYIYNAQSTPIILSSIHLDVKSRSENVLVDIDECGNSEPQFNADMRLIVTEIGTIYIPCAFNRQSLQSLKQISAWSIGSPAIYPVTQIPSPYYPLGSGLIATLLSSTAKSKHLYQCFSTDSLDLEVLYTVEVLLCSNLNTDSTDIKENHFLQQIALSTQHTNLKEEEKDFGFKILSSEYDDNNRSCPLDSQYYYTFTDDYYSRPENISTLSHGLHVSIPAKDFDWYEYARVEAKTTLNFTCARTRYIFRVNSNVVTDEVSKKVGESICIQIPKNSSRLTVLFSGAPNITDDCECVIFGLTTNQNVPAFTDCYCLNSYSETTVTISAIDQLCWNNLTMEMDIVLSSYSQSLGLSPDVTRNILYHTAVTVHEKGNKSNEYIKLEMSTSQCQIRGTCISSNRHTKEACRIQYTDDPTWTEVNNLSYPVNMRFVISELHPGTVYYFKFSLEQSFSESQISTLPAAAYTAAAVIVPTTFFLSLVYLITIIIIFVGLCLLKKLNKKFIVMAAVLIYSSILFVITIVIFIKAMTTARDDCNHHEFRKIDSASLSLSILQILAFIPFMLSIIYLVCTRQFTETLKRKEGWKTCCFQCRYNCTK